MKKYLLFYPNNNEPARRWVASAILSRFSDDFKLQSDRRKDWLLVISGIGTSSAKEEKLLRIDDSFFKKAGRGWLTSESMPEMPLPFWQVSDSRIYPLLVEETVPVLYGRPGFNVDTSGCGVLNLDVFGSSFFMLSRYEEAVIKDRDVHGRFRGAASIAYRAGFLGRPIVDEYVEILMACLKHLSPSLDQNYKKAKTYVSCDVDRPYEFYVKSLPATIRKFGGDLLKRRSINEAMGTLANYLLSKRKDFSKDPFNTFDWIMDVNEKVGNRVSFYFLVDRNCPQFDGYYDIQEHRIVGLMRRIHERGHEIGLHGSYDSYQDGSRIAKEVKILRTVMQQEGIHQDYIGARQHYLRWSVFDTPRVMDTAGIIYDSTLGFADYPGFRCGTCHEYPMYDLVRNQPLKIRQRPLVLMECSVLDEAYMGLGVSKAVEDMMVAFREISLRFSGDFTLLWHNSYLKSEWHKTLYMKLIGMTSNDIN